MTTGTLGPATSEPPPAWLELPRDVNELRSALWPATAHRDADGALRVGGVSVRELARRYGTPLFVLDEDDFRARARAFRAAVPDGDVHYAGKAFLCSQVARMAWQEGLRVDVCSAGELAVALRGGVPGADLTLHGNNKNDTELAMALAHEVGRIVVDSEPELDRLERLARRQGARPDVLVRVAVGLHTPTHHAVATAHDDQKFGLSIADGSAARALLRAARSDTLRLRGLHTHVGSQVVDASTQRDAAHLLLHLAARLRPHGVEVEELNLGGGFGVPYTAADRVPAAHAVAARLPAVVAAAAREHGLPFPRLAIEPGRAVVAPSTITVYEVGTVKVRSTRAFVSVDGGMSDNPRPSLYGADYACRLVSRRSIAAPRLSRVVGRHCETGDVVVRNECLPADVRAGDLLAVPVTGAYGRSMASGYNHTPRPAVVAVKDGADRLLVRRETLDDVLALDVPLSPRPARPCSSRSSDASTAAHAAGRQRGLLDEAVRT